MNLSTPQSPIHVHFAKLPVQAPANSQDKTSRSGQHLHQTGPQGWRLPRVPARRSELCHDPLTTCSRSAGLLFSSVDIVAVHQTRLSAHCCVPGKKRRRRNRHLGQHKREHQPRIPVASSAKPGSNVQASSICECPAGDILLKKRDHSTLALRKEKWAKEEQEEQGKQQRQQQKEDDSTPPSSPRRQDWISMKPIRPRL